jgi:hypothetical protein
MMGLKIKKGDTYKYMSPPEIPPENKKGLSPFRGSALWRS